ncbi:hypothetical protein SEA_WOLLYPOG_82 [Arthrobacter phage Wollypog]|uniref:Uncharacterized protein n=1 Tax=Arthrobacter phage Wollypog TaxID=2790985 RepID=A0A7T3KCB7_9CAUD|nr:hypothetical protein PP291_gp82 [Arthrobacter phage Wollypog]QPX62631.1 hypothetical protein SEA_WOLLYPOG_82 [Arthrobacter phage Wollypog]
MAKPQEIIIPVKIEIVPDPQSKDKAHSIVAEAIGAGSACWENLEDAGVFQSERAAAVVDAAMEALHKHYHLIPKGGNG